jgi:hypothetical protein
MGATAAFRCKGDRGTAATEEAFRFTTYTVTSAPPPPAAAGAVISPKPAGADVAQPASFGFRIPGAGISRAAGQPERRQPFSFAAPPVTAASNSGGYAQAQRTRVPPAFAAPAPAAGAALFTFGGGGVGGGAGASAPAAAPPPEFTFQLPARRDEQPPPLFSFGAASTDPASGAGLFHPEAPAAGRAPLFHFGAAAPAPVAAQPGFAATSQPVFSFGGGASNACHWCTPSLQGELRTARCFCAQHNSLMQLACVRRRSCWLEPDL